jgi:hypothetical protein
MQANAGTPEQRRQAQLAFENIARKIIALTE